MFIYDYAVADNAQGQPEKWAKAGMPAAKRTVTAFWAALERRMASEGDVTAMVSRMQQEAREMEAQAAGDVVDEASRVNLHYLTALVAAHRMLSQRMTVTDSKALIRDCFTGQYHDLIRDATVRWLDGMPDPFKAVTDLSRLKQVDSFGAAFTFEHERDDANGYIVNVHRCFYHDFLAEKGAVELTTLFCDFDAGWIEGIDPERHGVRFERPTTIGYGGTKCPFRFLRVARSNVQ